jgi:hypothetical protein
MKLSSVFASAVAASVLLIGISSLASQEVTLPVTLPMQVTLNVNASDCDNSPGPFITLEGEIAVGGVKAQLIFQNNVKGTHRTTRTVGTTAVLIPAGEGITIPKQPCLGGVGGNPWIYIQLFNAQGNLTPEILLGRCVQGLTISEDVLNTALLTTLITATDCSNNPGPWITLEGALTLSSLKARVIFRNNVKGTHENKDNVVEVELLGDGAKVVIPKQPSRGGVGGNPWIWVQFLDGSDVPIADPVFLGRCSEM